MSAAPFTPGKLVWNDSLKLGVPEIDEQHALLFGMMNRLLDHPESLAYDELIVDILTDLGKFLILHFQTEEAMMRKLGMPPEEYEQHVHAHNIIIDEYAELNLAAARGKHHTAAEIFAMVKQWVSDHLHASDAKIRNYVPVPSPD
ncbi:MAG: hemerythrin family protein [Pseudomonadota bacterium]|jgi:hemerythrin